MTRLLIGDATGKIHLLHIKDTETGEESIKVRPKIVAPHPQPDEDSMWAGRGSEISSDLIRTGIIVLNADKEIGAVQGPKYSTAGWYCPAAHKDGDPKNPLLAEFASKQQFTRIEAGEINPDRRNLSLSRLPPVRESTMAKFAKSRDLELTKLDNETLSRLLGEGWVYKDEYELEGVEDSIMGGRLVKKLRKGEDWEEDWMELEEKDWVYLDGETTM